MTKTLTTELLSVARAMRDYIDALPSDVVASLPTMPGFDRDWADEAIEAANREAQPVASREHFENLCNQFWNWDEFDEINAEEEPRLQWDGKNYTHRVTAALWRMYQSSPPAPAPAVPEEINPDSPIIIGILPD